MRNRDYFLPSLTSLVISAMMVFLSCAHQERDGEEDYSESEQVVSDAGTTESTSGSDDLSDITQLEQGAVENSETAKAISEVAAPTDGASSDPTLDALGVPTDNEMAAAATTDSAATSDATAKELESLTAEVPAEQAAATAVPETTAEIDNSVLGLDSAPASDKPVDTVAALEPAPQVPAMAEPLPAPEALPTELPAALESTPSTSFSSAPRIARAPKIPKKAISRKGVSLNRYYFTRSGDTPKSVSQLIYGDSAYSKKLTSWNGKGWKPGKVVYYQSPSEASDLQMRSFYQERNVPTEEHEVARGEWLSKIAKRSLGSAGSWKEIAVINGMRSPDALEVGQKLAILPRDLSAFAPGQQPLEEEAPQAKLDPAPKVSAPVAQETVQAPPAEEPVAPAAEAIPAPVEEPKKVAKKSNQGLDLEKLIDQNLFPIVIGAGVIILLLALSAVNRRKKARGGDEFGDDGFAPPSKLKRR